MVNNRSIDKYELTCCIKVLVNKHWLAETSNKTRHKQYIPNCAVFISKIVIFCIFKLKKSDKILILLWDNIWKKGSSISELNPVLLRGKRSNTQRNFHIMMDQGINNHVKTKRAHYCLNLHQKLYKLLMFCFPLLQQDGAIDLTRNSLQDGFNYYKIKLTFNNTVRGI